MIYGIRITDADGTRVENFEDGNLDIGVFMNIQDSAPFGEWTRLSHFLIESLRVSGGLVLATFWFESSQLRHSW